jgi:hypothetical protein
LRLLQVHFAIIVVTSGLHKLQLGPWWGGVALWYPLHSPYQTSEAGIRSLAPNRGVYLFFISLAQYIALGWQIGFPLFAWRRGLCRIMLVGGAILGWLACWQIYHLPIFGPFYLVCCLAFLTPSEWSAIGRWPRRQRGALPAKSKLPASKEASATAS